MSNMQILQQWLWESCSDDGLATYTLCQKKRAIRVSYNTRGTMASVNTARKHVAMLYS